VVDELMVEDVPRLMANRRYRAAQERKRAVLARVRAGMTITAARADAGVGKSAYEKWRQSDKRFVAAMDAAKAYAAGLADDRQKLLDGQRNFTLPEFFAVYFGQPPADFHIDVITAMHETRPGDILMVQFPPGHGKTSIFENYANWKLATDPEWRSLVGSESTDISKKILGRIRKRMEPLGPTPEYVAHYGPFGPQYGEGLRKPAQKWADDAFSVYRKREHDERNHSMEAVSPTTSIVSARTDHLHLDDIQSLKSLKSTPKVTEWFRQDALTRPGEEGITTIFGTKVGDHDFYELLEDDPDLHDILRVIRLPAIVTDEVTGQPRPLWPKPMTIDHKTGEPRVDEHAPGFTLDSLDRIRRKVGKDVWDRAYMMTRSAGAGTFTFGRDDVEKVRDGQLSMSTPVAEGSVCIVGVDPALGGRNCVLLAECSTEGKLVFRRWWEQTNLQANAQIIAQVRLAVEHATLTGGVVSDVIVEANNFQRGLVFEETFLDLKREYGFNVRPHQTNINKYDDEIGVASMATSFVRGEVVTAWADDELTRFWTGEFERQLLSWKPNITAVGKSRNKGSLLRQDMVMALDVETPLWTTDGWSTIGSVRVGQRVATPSGDTAEVIAKTEQRVRPVWRVNLRGQGSLRADADHRWWVECTTTGAQRLAPRWMTTAEIRDAMSMYRRIQVQLPEPMEMPDVDLPLDPYVLGLWLGDGDARQATIFQSPSDRPMLMALVEECGYRTSPHASGRSFGVLGIRSRLSNLELLNNKHIPAIYLRGSFKQRLALLQGLMDTDGTVINGAPSPGRCTFGNTNKNLVDGAAFLARSLGFRVQVYESPPTIAPTPFKDASPIQRFWRVTFFPTSESPCPFRMPRKADRMPTTATRRRRTVTIDSVEPDGIATVQCITVDHPTSQFLAGTELIATGNCAWFCWLWWRRQYKRFNDTRTSDASFTRSGVPWRPTRAGLLVPAGR